MRLANSFQGEIQDVKYIRKSDLPCKSVPSLTDMASRALCYLYKNPLPDHNWECRFAFAPSALPPFCPDPELAEKAGLVDPIMVGDTESRNDVVFSMMREMCGDWKSGVQAEEQVHKRLTGYVKPQGFGRYMSWCRGYAMGGYSLNTYASIWATDKLLHSECLRCREGRGNADLARKLFEGLMEAATRENGRAYYVNGISLYDEESVVGYPGHYPIVMNSLCEYWRLTGDARCWTLMTELAEGFLCDLQPANLHRPDGGIDGHNHVNLHAIRGVAQFAHLSGEPRYLRWVKDIYDYYRKWALDTGWLPEIRDLEDHSNHSETCLNADMFEIELWLALSGYDELWDQMDRDLRNYFFLTQFRLTDEYIAWYREVHKDASEAEIQAGIKTLKELEGGFISAVTPNDYIFEVREGGQHFGSVPYHGKNVVFDMMGCCPPSGMRAIYWAWKYAQVTEEHTTTVHLPMDSDSPHAAVKSELPACGHLNITMKLGGDLLVRIPLWAPRDQVAVKVNRRDVPVVWSGTAQQYVLICGLLPGDTVDVTYLLIDMWQTDSVTPFHQDTQTYRYHWVGNTVVDVIPQAAYFPLYGFPGFNPLFPKSEPSPEGTEPEVPYPHRF